MQFENDRAPFFCIISRTATSGCIQRFRRKFREKNLEVISVPDLHHNLISAGAGRQSAPAPSRCVSRAERPHLQRANFKVREVRDLLLLLHRGHQRFALKTKHRKRLWEVTGALLMRMNNISTSAPSLFIRGMKVLC